MKFAFFFLLAAASTAHAVDVSVNLDVKSRTQLSWNKVDKFRHSGDCYPFGKGERSDELGSETIDGQVYVTDARVSPDGAPALSVISLESKQRPIRLGSFDITLSRSRLSATSDAYSLQFVHQAPMNAHVNLGDSKCVLHEYHWNAQKTEVVGTYSLRIVMPSDSRIIKLKLGGTGHAINFDQLEVRGDYPTQIMSAGEEFYLWGKPGAILEIPMKLKFYSTGGFDGRLDLTVSQPGLAAQADVLAALTTSLKEFDSKTPQTVEAFLNAGAAIAGRADVAASVVAKMGIDPIRTLNTKLFELANAFLPKTKYARDVKAMSAVVSYELAMALLDNLKGFCATKSVYLPLTDQTVQRQGFLVAYFWISQSIQQVQSLNFPEVEEFLNGLTRWENDGLKYSDIANDKVAFARMVDAFKKLRTQSRFAWPVYAPLKATLQKVVSTFGTVGSDANAINEIYRQIDELAKTQSDLNQRVQKVSFSFIKTNPDRISASPILNDLKKFEDQANELSKTMANSLKFYSLNTGGTSANLLGVMTDSLAHQVGLFEKKLQDPFIEAIRRTFQSSSRVTDLKASYNQCLEVK